MSSITNDNIAADNSNEGIYLCVGFSIFHVVSLEGVLPGLTSNFSVPASVSMTFTSHAFLPSDPNDSVKPASI